MLNSREVKILEFLIKHGNIPEDEILEKNGINKRVFSYNLQNINIFLKNMGLKKIEKKGEILHFDINQNLKKIYSAIENTGKFDQKERIKILEFKLFFDKKLNLKKISEDLEVSKTTIKKDFRILKEILGEKKIKVLYKNNFGYYLKYNNLENEEWLKTKKIEEFLFRNKEERKIYLEYIRKIFLNNFGQIEENKISDFLNDINKHLKLNIKDDTYKVLYSYLLVIINEKNDKEKVSLSFIEETKEFKIITDSLKKNNIEILNKVSIIKFADFLMGVTINKLNLENWLNEEILIRKMMKEFFRYTDLAISNDEILFECLLYHLKPTIYRIKKGIHITNPVFRELIENKDPILDITRKVISVAEKEIGISFPEDEVALLGYHFKASVERNADYIRKKVILVCGLGEGTSKLLERNLKENFNMEILAVIPYYKLEETVNSGIKIDLILTTLELKDIYGIPVLTIKPLLDEKDINKISEYGIFRRKRKILLSELLKVIEESDDKEKLIKKLENKFKDNILDDINYKKKNAERFISYSDIMIYNENLSWEQAIKMIGKNMREMGYITDKYIQEMIDIIKKLGSYIVIEEGIAIPHGSISENVLKDGIFILISKKEVFLPNEKPVNIFIAFAIKERENQQKILKFIFNLASKENLKESLLKCKNTKDIIDYLEEIQC
jgi:putative transcriptional antiterminator, bglG